MGQGLLIGQGRVRGVGPENKKAVSNVKNTTCKSRCAWIAFEES